MVKSERFKKQSWKPGNVLWPVPVVLVSCGGTEGWKPNLITIAWTGSVCSDPPMLSISVRPERYSHVEGKWDGSIYSFWREDIFNKTVLIYIWIASTN